MVWRIGVTALLDLERENNKKRYPGIYNKYEIANN